MGVNVWMHRFASYALPEGSAMASVFNEERFMRTCPPEGPAVASTSRRKSTEFRCANLNLRSALSVLAT
eukprot:1161733-Pelagomonas_calceolata.AAC.7